MNFVRLLRSQAGVTQQELADRAQTSQPTIALYESGAKSPNISTLQKLAVSLGLAVIITYTPCLSREDQRSLAYHRAIARMLRQNPITCIKRARKTLNKMHKQHPEARVLFDRWYLWLDLSIEELIVKILDPEIMARDMRQVSPFAGLLQPQERVKILSQFRKEYGL